MLNNTNDSNPSTFNSETGPYFKMSISTNDDSTNVGSIEGDTQVHVSSPGNELMSPPTAAISR